MTGCDLLPTVRYGRVRRRAVTGTRSRVTDWLAANTLAAVTIAGALMYGITRISYVGFYGEFGLDPEDVGIGYAATLARALPGLLFWFVLLGLGLLAYYALMVWRYGVDDPERVSRPRRLIAWFDKVPKATTRTSHFAALAA